MCSEKVNQNICFWNGYIKLKLYYRKMGYEVIRGKMKELLVKKGKIISISLIADTAKKDICCSKREMIIFRWHYWNLSCFRSNVHEYSAVRIRSFIFKILWIIFVTWRTKILRSVYQHEFFELTELLYSVTKNVEYNFYLTELYWSLLW